MLDWISNHQELLIALFGAGGIGAVLLTRLLGKGKGGESKPVAKTPDPTVSASADQKGVAIAHGGHGDVHANINDAIGKEALQSMQDGLSLSPAETLWLLRICENVGLSADEIEALIGRLSETSASPDFDTLGEAVRAKDDTRAALLVGRLSSSSSAAAPAKD